MFHISNIPRSFKIFIYLVLKKLLNPSLNPDTRLNAATCTTTCGQCRFSDLHLQVIYMRQMFIDFILIHLASFYNYICCAVPYRSRSGRLQEVGLLSLATFFLFLSSAASTAQPYFFGSILDAAHKSMGRWRSCVTDYRVAVRLTNHGNLLAVKSVHVLAVKSVHVLAVKSVHVLAVKSVHVLAVKSVHVVAVFLFQDWQKTFVAGRFWSLVD